MYYFWFRVIFQYQKSFNERLLWAFEYKIAFWICGLVVWNVRITAFCIKETIFLVCHNVVYLFYLNISTLNVKWCMVIFCITGKEYINFFTFSFPLSLFLFLMKIRFKDWCKDLNFCQKTKFYEKSISQ
jgi:hypothetical protein